MTVINLAVTAVLTCVTGISIAVIAVIGVVCHMLPDNQKYSCHANLDSHENICHGCHNCHVCHGPSDGRRNSCHDSLDNHKYSFHRLHIYHGRDSRHYSISRPTQSISLMSPCPCGERQKSRKCSENTGGRLREERHNDNFGSSDRKFKILWPKILDPRTENFALPSPWHSDFIHSKNYVGQFTNIFLRDVQWTKTVSLWRRGEIAGNALRTLGGALGRRGAMTSSSLESCILRVTSNVWNVDFIHSKGPRRSFYRFLVQQA